jgi:hypothetical protein
MGTTAVVYEQSSGKVLCVARVDEDMFVLGSAGVVELPQRSNEGLVRRILDRNPALWVRFEG